MSGLHDEALAYTCPHCLAQPTHSCVDQRSVSWARFRDTDTPHRERLQIAREARKVATQTGHLAITFGTAVAVLRLEPELRALFDEAVASGEWDETAGDFRTPPMTADEFAARLRATTWYQRHDRRLA